MQRTKKYHLSKFTSKCECAIDKVTKILSYCLYRYEYLFVSKHTAVSLFSTSSQSNMKSRMIYGKKELRHEC